MKEAVLDGEQPGEGQAPATEDTPAKKDTDWWGEAKGIFWLILIVLGFHSFVAKPFYIPSESMLPGLRIGDRLVVTKFAYGWSYVSPTIPNPVAIFNGLVLHKPEDSWSFGLPFIHGRLFGSLPTRGDIAIVTPPGTQNDYIKRVIGLPGDTLQVRNGVVILNGRALTRGPLHYVDIPVDTNSPCSEGEYPGARVRAANGGEVCHLPVVTETLPNGRRYDTVELGYSPGDDYGPIRIPRRACLHDGRQSRPVGGQPVSARPARARRSGSLREFRRARGVHHLQPRRRCEHQSADVVGIAAFGPCGADTASGAREIA